MKPELKAELKKLLFMASDEQRRILHNRLNELVKTDENADNFVIEIMRELPYPNFDKLLTTFEKLDTNKHHKGL